MDERKEQDCNDRKTNANRKRGRKRTRATQRHEETGSKRLQEEKEMVIEAKTITQCTDVHFDHVQIAHSVDILGVIVYLAQSKIQIGTSLTEQGSSEGKCEQEEG